MNRKIDIKLYNELLKHTDPRNLEVHLRSLKLWEDQPIKEYYFKDAFSQLYYANNNEYLVKICRSSEDKQKIYAIHEFIVCLLLNHENIVKPLMIYNLEDVICTVWLKFKGHTLNYYLEKNEYLSPDVLANIFI